MKEYFEEISKYEFDKDNILDFIATHEETPEFKIFKSFIFDIVETRKQFLNLFDIYYYLNLKEKYENYENANQLFDKFLLDFTNGDSKEFLEFLSWINEKNSIYSKINKISSLDGYASSLGFLYGQRKRLKYGIDIIITQDKENKKKIFKSEKITINKYNKSGNLVAEIPEKGISAIFSYFKYKKNHDETRMNYQKQLDEIESKIEEKKLQLLEENEDLNLGEYLSYFLEDIQKDRIVVEKHRLIPNLAKKLKQDLYCSACLAKNFLTMVEYSKSNDFKSICDNIRQNLIDNDAPNDNKITNEFRKVSLGDEGFMGSTTSPEQIEEEFDKLNDIYKEIMKETNPRVFIKKVADFHFNFIKLHPYMDGNGRTSRILLKIMLAAHNLYLPSLYVNNIQKEDFYLRSNAAFRGDYTKIENDLLERIGHFYPITEESYTREEEKSNLKI